MTILMFSHQPEEVVVVTDTLATADVGKPSFFKTKTFVIPHVPMVVAMTGISNLGESLVSQLFSSFLAIDVDMVAAHTQGLLVGLQADLDRQFGRSELTSTVYYFGYSPTDQQYVRYAFRSTNGYTAERSTEGGFGVKPGPTSVPLVTPETIAEMINLAEVIRADQALVPIEERIHIGGALTLTTMRDGFISTSILHRFHDFQEQWHAMHDYHDAWTA